MMPYDFRHLRVFIAVAEELSFRRAASRLNMAQPAVSRVIADLEERLGVMLLRRTTRSVNLTEAGRFLLDDARSTLARMEVTAQTARMLATGERRHIDVAYTTIAAHTLVPRIVKRFADAHSDIEVRLRYLGSEAQRDAILRGSIDIGFFVGPFSAPSIECRDMASDPLTVVLPRDHRLGAQETVTPKDLAEEPILIGQPDDWGAFRRIVIEVFQSAGCVPNITMQVPTLWMLLGLVSARCGVTIFAGWPPMLDGSALQVRPIRTDTHPSITTSMVWRSGDQKDAVRDFIATALSTDLPS